MHKKPTYLYTDDGAIKVNIKTSTLIGDVLKDLNIARQGNRSQLWRSASGRYFMGSCLDNPLSTSYIYPISNEAARKWVVQYYGGDKLADFGFEDAEEI